LKWLVEVWADKKLIASIASDKGFALKQLLWDSSPRYLYLYTSFLLPAILGIKL